MRLEGNRIIENDNKFANFQIANFQIANFQIICTFAILLITIVN